MSLSAAVAPGNAPAQCVPIVGFSTPRGCHRPLAASASVPRRPELAALAERVRQLQATRRPALKPCPTGLTKLDAALGGGFARGCIHELLAPAEGAPARSLALWAAARCVLGGPEPRQAEIPGSRKWVFYLDTVGDFYPPGAAQFGLPLKHLLVVRTPRTADALWVCEQTLRCKVVAAVVLPIRTVDPYVSRRLQLAAETGGGLGFLLRPENRSGHTFAATRLRIDPLPCKDPTPCLARDGASVLDSLPGNAPARLDPSPGMDADSDGIYAPRRVRVTLLKLRDGRPTEPFELALPLVATGGATHPSPLTRPPLRSLRFLRSLRTQPPPDPSAASAS